MGLTSAPRTRNRTYTSATPVNSGDLNDIQDALVKDWTQLNGVQRLSVPCDSRCQFDGATAGTASFTKTNGLASCLLSTATGAIQMPLPFVPGDRILSFRVVYTTGPSPTPRLRFVIPGSSFYVSSTYNATFGTVAWGGGFSIQQYDVDTPTALWIRNPNPGTPDPLRWARSADLELIAAANATTLLGVDFLYDRTDIVEGG